MHKYRLCSLSLDILIQPDGPILIKSPHEGAVNPAIPDMSFVRTRSPVANHLGMTVYLPGSSLKGVFRSYCEGIGRAIGLQPDVCNPFNENSRCRREPNPSSEMPVPQRYKTCCHICRLFGSTRLGGRIAISDAYPTEATVTMMNATGQRTGVGIDRLLGSSHSGALYDFEVVERGEFLARIKLENFELWQVGLLALALRDLNAGHLRIGFGTSRGMGFVKADVQRAEARYIGLLVNSNGGERQLRNRNATPFPLEHGEQRLLYGVAKLMGSEAEAYGMKSNGAVKISLDADRISGEGVEVSVLLKSPESIDLNPLHQFFRACVERLQQEIKETPEPPDQPVGGEEE